MATLNFWTTGEFFTNIVRDLWASLMPKNALESLDVGDQLSSEVAIEICTGEKKLEGDTRKGELTIVNDDGKHKLPSLEDVIDGLEAQFLREELVLRTMREDIYNEYAHWFGQKNVDEEKFKRPAQRVKATIEQLACVYPLVGKSIVDLPIDKLLTYVSKEELRRRQQFDRVGVAVESTMARRVTAGFGMDSDALDVENFVRKIVADGNRSKIEAENITTSKFTSGYICREGRFYGCADFRHPSFAKELLEAGLIPDHEDSDDAWKLLDQLGWIKFTVGRFLDDIGNVKLKWSQDQKRVAKAYLNKTGKKNVYYNGEKLTTKEFYRRIEC